jgi:hypothetical protein
LKPTVSAIAVLGLALTSTSVLAQGNLASRLDGAKAEEVSSTLDRASSADNLLDGDPGTTWATGRGKVRDQYVIVKLAVRRPVDIGAIALNNSVAVGHPAEAALRQFKLAVSATGTSDEDFVQVKLGSCQLDGGRQVYTFTPARAEYVRLTVAGNFGHPDWIELAELEVFPAGAPPVEGAGSPSVLLLSPAADPAVTPLAAVAASLVELGATVGTAPGPGTSRTLSAAALQGFRVALVTAERAPDRGESRLLSRHVERGGGLVCAVPADPTALQPLLEAFGVAAVPSVGGGENLLLGAHWITDGLALSQLEGPVAALTLEGATALAQLSDGSAAGVAGERSAGRVVLLPEACLMGELGPDALELSRRAILWAAAMEDTPAPKPPEPVQLAGRALFLPGATASGLGFEELRRAARERGLALDDYGGESAAFSRAALGDAALLIAVMPAPSEVVSLDLADWVRSGGGLLVLGDAAADVPTLVAVNGFLREFNGAMALSPARNLSVAVRRHPVTQGVEALSRPGEPLGVWCLQGTPLATMGATPVALARTFGEGRLIAMDAGFAADFVEPPTDRKNPPPASGIQLQQNREFVLRCLAWLLGQD